MLYTRSLSCVTVSTIYCSKRLNDSNIFFLLNNCNQRNQDNQLTQIRTKCSGGEVYYPKLHDLDIPLPTSAIDSGRFSGFDSDHEPIWINSIGMGVMRNRHYVIASPNKMRIFDYQCTTDIGAYCCVGSHRIARSSSCDI